MLTQEWRRLLVTNRVAFCVGLSTESPMNLFELTSKVSARSSSSYSLERKCVEEMSRCAVWDVCTNAAKEVQVRAVSMHASAGASA